MLPPAFLDRVRQQLGPEYEAFLASYHRPRALGLRLNPLKTDRPPILPFTLSPCLGPPTASGTPRGAARPAPLA